MNVRHGLAAGALGLVFATAVAACSTTVHGSGHAVRGSMHATDFPAPSGSGSPAPSESSTSSLPRETPSSGQPAGTFTCPTIEYPHAHLRFDCIVAGMTLNTSNSIWPVSMYKRVETKTDWVVEEGAGNWPDPGSDSLKDIARTVRTQMIEDGGYGSSPTLTVVRDADTTVGGVRAHVLQTTVTLNPSWARGRGTKVKAEKLWIIAMQASATDDTVWYTSVPDLVSSLWAKVPAIIKSIQVS